MWHTVEYFRDDVMQVTEDPKTGLFTISVDWHDPALAAEWASQIVILINERLKGTSIRETNRSLDHLNKELELAKHVEIKRVIAGMAQTYIEALMFADIRDEFAFRTIDGAVQPPDDEYEFPSRLIFLAAGILLGALGGAFAAVALPGLRSRRSRG